MDTIGMIILIQSVIKKDEFKEIHAEFKDISFYSKHEDEEDFSDSVIAEKLKTQKLKKFIHMLTLLEKKMTLNWF